MLHLHPKSSVYFRAFFIAVLLSSSLQMYGFITSLDKFDPFKVYSPIDPQDFLLDRTKLHREGTSWWDQVGNHCKISISGYFQSADSGKPMDGGDIPVVSAINGETNAIGFQYVPILDLTGRTPMIPLVMSTTLPDSSTVIMPPTSADYGPLLKAATNALFTGATPTPPVTLPVPLEPPLPNIESVIDPMQNFGFFSFPSKYRKRGARMDLEINLLNCVGLHVRGGFGAVCHVPKPPINETGCETPECPFDPVSAGYPNVIYTNVDDFLMNQFDCIMKEIGMGYETYQRTGLEEIMTELYWRYPISLNQDRKDWLQIIAIPYIEGGFSYSPSDARNTNELYNVPLGNNKHLAAGFSTGICLDFLETIEVGGELGYTHFFAHDFDCYRIPNSKLQNNIFPFNTSVTVAPGRNLYFGIKLTARNFLEKLSGYFQFIALEHAADCITLKESDPAFVPDVLARKTGYKVKVANLALTYPLTPNFIAGFLWQAPISQRGAVRTTTIMFGLTASF